MGTAVVLWPPDNRQCVISLLDFHCIVCLFVCVCLCARVGAGVLVCCSTRILPYETGVRLISCFLLVAVDAITVGTDNGGRSSPWSPSRIRFTS